MGDTPLGQWISREVPLPSFVPPIPPSIWSSTILQATFLPRTHHPEAVAGQHLEHLSLLRGFEFASETFVEALPEFFP